jgi:two-component system sensor histidine kinase KdpD
VGGWGLGAWLLAVGACTLLLWSVRDAAHEAHMALAYLLIVLGGSARHGRVVGLVLAVVSFLTFNFFLLPPYYTLAIEDPLDWWVLLSFLITGTVAAELFHRTQQALETAESRAREVERLSALGAESLSVPRASDAVEAIARVIRSELPVRSAEVWMFDEDTDESVLIASAPGGAPGAPPATLLPASVRHGRPVLVGPDGHEEAALAGERLAHFLVGDTRCATILVPLMVRDHNLGVLRLTQPEGLRFDQAQAVFADTLSYYAALAVERVRLSAEVEHVDALREADRLKDALLASVSHDLRTPLTTIRALASELRASGDERSVVIEEEADRLNRVVTDLLDLSRLRSGVLPLEPEINAAEDLVGAMLQRLGGLARPDRIEISLPAGGALPVGQFDFVHALRALGNLVENALRHSPETEPVELRVSEEDDSLVFAVLDRGPGVPESERGRIFEPFFQSSSGAGHRGTGLGLAIARSVAEAQGGSVRYRPRPGGGSVFELRLPGDSLESML